MTTTAIGDWKELARRECDGLVVSLFWRRGADRVKVAVADRQLDEEFHLDVPGAYALDAFHHPFAYAEAAALALRCASSLDLQPQN